MTIDPTTAAGFARLTLGHLGREYPHILAHVLDGLADARTPRALHPIFHGSFDWHSCVHGWWQVLRLARRHPHLPEAAEIVARADAAFTPDAVAGEIAYFERPSARGFERPYGWAWLLALHGEAALHPGRGWAGALEPLARLIAARLLAHLPSLTYPIRTGAHHNTAFALVLAHEWAIVHDADLAAAIEARALHWFAADRACPAWGEPDGDAFLSPTLVEAVLMSRLLGRAAFADWFAGFLPDLAARRPATLFAPAHVSDRSDGKIAHLDGLNLSRAWCWRAIAAALDEGAPREMLRATAADHLAASLPHLGDDYMGEHWLATFALLALDDQAPR